MSGKKELKTSTLTLLLWIIMAVLLVAGGVFAWFTFNTKTNVTPDTAGTISDGGAGLLIANRINGDYGEQCDLILQSTGGDLSPVSTAYLDRFYCASAQNSSGIAQLYTNVTGQINDCSIHGMVYLKSEGAPLDVYLYQQGCSFGNDIQALASMRLGLKVTVGNETNIVIFKLDEMADTSRAKTQVTTPMENVVVSAINNGSAVYVPDPARNLSVYSVTGEENLTPGSKKITTVSSDQIATVEYWLYLEGCDAQCINDVQKKDVALALAFAGTSAK